MATVGEGESCESQPCDPDLTCAMGKCVGVQTAALAMKGEACDASKPCASFLRCDNGVCAELVGEGGACAGYGDCNFATSCVQQVCTAPQVVPDGQPCQSSLECADVSYCVFQGQSGVCKRLLNDGEDCSSGGRCMFPASCEQGVCTLPQPDVCK